MIYLLFGKNSYQAVRKIMEFKSAFLKKNGEHYLIEEFDGEELTRAPRDVFGGAGLFVKARLVILKNVIFQKASLAFFKSFGGDLKKMPSVYLFWEENLKKNDKEFAFFEKYSEKIQEVAALDAKALDLWLQKKAASLGIKLNKEERELMTVEAGDGAEWALENMLEKLVLSVTSSARNERVTHPPIPLPYSKGGGVGEGFLSSSRAQSSPFGFVERIFSAPLGKALIALKEATLAGHEPQKFIYPLLWKAKQKKMPDAYWQGILTEAEMRRDPKNTYEHLERFIFSIKA